MGLLRWLFGERRMEGASELPSLGTMLREEANAKRAASYKGKHYTEYVPEVKRLKREKKHEQAIALLLELVAATEREAAVTGHGVAPAYYRDLAILYRKEKRYGDEVRTLERYCEQQERYGYGPGDLSERLEKAKALRDKHSSPA